MRLVALRAAVAATLISTFFASANHSSEHLIFPVSRVAWNLFSHSIAWGPGEDGLMSRAWIFGPVAFGINALACCPLTLAISYAFRRRLLILRLWDWAVLVFGTLLLVGGVISGFLLVVGIVSSEYPSDILDHYFLNFVVFPAILSGTASAVSSFRLLQSGVAHQR